MRLYTYDSLYNLSKHRFLELKHHCAQYPTWKERRRLNDTLGAFDCLPRYDPTGRLAIENKWLDDQTRHIEETLAEMYPEPLTDGQKAELMFLKEAIFLPENKKPDVITFQYRKFFWLLDKKL